ncbi:MAG: phosphoenolpyruvate--protein phosphotransferase [Culicoidibacterales bacterium]
MKLTGIGASKGIAIAKVYKFEQPVLNVAKVENVQVDAELSRLQTAMEQSKQDLERLRENAMKSLGEDKAQIFDAHLLMLQDPEMNSAIENKIKAEAINSEAAIDEVTNMFIMMFESMDNEYMRERAADIKDIKKRLLSHLQGVIIPDLTAINEEVIIVAEDLTPSETSQLNRKFVKGFATNIGGRTSHSAIMARSLEIPAVVGLKTVLDEVQHGQMLVLDGETGEVNLTPTDADVKQAQDKSEALAAWRAQIALLKDKKTETNDGVHVELGANIGTPNDLEGVVANGAEAIGLYRTEFLYMDASEAPSEDEQFEAYKAVLSGMDGKPVVVRTLDIGGDKELPYMHLPAEMNPFLGYRAVRICLHDKPLFRTQLRALLRASVYGNLRVMFPMIATVDEFKEAKSFLEEVKAELVSEGIAVSDAIQVGMMIEIPAAAVIADQFAKHADFFSIGTNDLIQYTMAADRMNEKVSYLYQPYNPSILRLIKMVADAAHKYGRWAGMCGEMAGELNAIPLLLGLGLDELSMSATSVLPARELLSRISKKEAELLVEKALECETETEVLALVETFLNA